MFGAGSNGAGGGASPSTGGGGGGSGGANGGSSSLPVLIPGGGGNYGGGGGSIQNPAYPAGSPTAGHGSGAGGALAYANNITVSPGGSYPVTVGAAGESGNSPLSPTPTVSGSGAVRIVWPGNVRKFPSTLVSTT